MSQQLPPVIQNFVRAKHGNAQVKIDAYPYWSTVRFASTLAGAIAVGSVQAFGYAIGGDMAAAGRAAVLATLADTNLQKAGETRLNADLFVMGVGACPTPDSEPALIKRVWRECAVEISTDGQNTAPLATLEMLPAGGGLMGAGRSAIKVPSLSTTGIAVDRGEGAATEFLSNGNPMSGNIFMLAAPVLWTGQQGVDSNFRLNFRIDRAIAEPVAVARAAAAGVAAYSLPAALGDPGTFVDIRVRLLVWAISKLSLNG